MIVLDQVQPGYGQCSWICIRNNRNLPPSPKSFTFLGTNVFLSADPYGGGSNSVRAAKVVIVESVEGGEPEGP